MHLNDAPRMPRTWVPTIPQDLERIVLWAMEKRAEQRVASARELRDALKRFISRPDMFDVGEVVNVSHLKAALERTYEPSPESITDELEVPVINVAGSSDAGAARSTPSSGRDTLIDEPVRERATPEEIPIPRRTPLPVRRPDAPQSVTQIETAPRGERPVEVIAQPTWRASSPELPAAAFEYDGPNPFWLLDPAPRRIGPCDHETLHRLILSLVRSGQAEEACVSADGTAWLSMKRYLQLTAARRRLSGRLLVETPEQRSEIFVREGQPVQVRSSRPDEQTPALLVSRSLIQPDSLPALIHTALESETRIEQILGTAVDLHVLRNALLKERLLSLMVAVEGRFVFDQDGGTPQGTPFAASLAALLPNLAYRALPTDAVDVGVAVFIVEGCALPVRDYQISFCVDARCILAFNILRF